MGGREAYPRPWRIISGVKPLEGCEEFLSVRHVKASSLVSYAVDCLIVLYSDAEFDYGYGPLLCELPNDRFSAPIAA
jgi:hypothetical protein